MMIQVILLVALVWPASVHSLRNVSRTPGVVAAESLVQPPLDACSLQELAEMLKLGPSYELKVESRTKLVDGNYRARLRLYYKQVPLRGFLLTATQSEDSFTGAVSGYIPNVNDVNTNIEIPTMDLQQKLLSYVTESSQDYYGVEGVCIEDLSNFTSIKQILVDLETGKSTLVYFCRAVVSISPIRWPRLIVNAATGEIIQSSIEVSLLKDQFEGRVLNEDFKLDLNTLRNDACPRFIGGNTRCPVFFGPGLNEVCLNATVNGSYTVLANDRVVVKSMNQGLNKNAATTVKFKTITGPDDASNEAFAPAEDAFYCAMKSLDLYAEWGNETLDTPGPLQVYVDAGMDFTNSFYDGSAAIIGYGSSIMFPFTVCETIGHEIGHFVTDSKQNLAMRDESQGVVEGFCDVFAKSLSAYLNKGNVVNWIFGDCAVREGNQRIRFYDDPSKDDFGIDHLSGYIATDDAYRSLGIITKSFYCLIVTKRIPVKDAFRAFVFANKMYWDEFTGFVDAACGVYRSASDLRMNTDSFFDCFKNVGIDLTFCSLSGTKN